MVIRAAAAVAATAAAVVVVVVIIITSTIHCRCAHLSRTPNVVTGKPVTTSKVGRWHMRTRLKLIEFLILKRYFFHLSALKYTDKSPTVDLLRQNILRSKTACFFTPQGYIKTPLSCLNGNSLPPWK